MFTLYETQTEVFSVPLRLIFDFKRLIRILLPKEEFSSHTSIIYQNKKLPEFILTTIRLIHMQCHPSTKEPFKLPNFFLEQQNWSNFRKCVYYTLCTVLSGHVTSYLSLAIACASPKSARAVGQAMSQNPFPILIPCHRVIRSNGNLGNYRGGTELKEHLLQQEGALDKKKIKFTLP